MRRQSGLSLISTLIVGMILVAMLVLGFRLIPVYNEYFSVKKALAGVVASTDPAAPASTFRSALQKYKDVEDMPSMDVQSVQISKDGGATTLQVSYRREVPLFANVGLYFDFDVKSGS